MLTIAFGIIIAILIIIFIPVIIAGLTEIGNIVIPILFVIGGVVFLYYNITFALIILGIILFIFSIFSTHRVIMGVIHAGDLRSYLKFIWKKIKPAITEEQKINKITYLNTIEIIKNKNYEKYLLNKKNKLTLKVKTLQNQLNKQLENLSRSYISFNNVEFKKEEDAGYFFINNKKIYKVYVVVYDINFLQLLLFEGSKRYFIHEGEFDIYRKKTFLDVQSNERIFKKSKHAIKYLRKIMRKDIAETVS